MYSPTLTYVIATRNDNFCGDSPGRLVNTVSRLVELDRDHRFELIVVDWGDTGVADLLKSRVPLEREGEWLRVLAVPQQISARFNSPFSEVHALNLAARRARSPWVGRIDQDTLVGDGFVRWFRALTEVESNAPYRKLAYFSTRRELPDRHVWNHFRIDSPRFFRFAVGILLVPRQAWHETRGYDEKFIHRCHMEHDFCVRLGHHCGVMNLGAMTTPQADFYHQPHDQCADRPWNSEMDMRTLQNQLRAGRPTYTNDEMWGLRDADDQIVEQIVGRGVNG